MAGPSPENIVSILCAIYVRFSELELQKETSADDQLRECREFAERQGWKVVEEYIDEGVRASNTGQRLEFAKLKEDAALGKFHVVLVWEMSRWTRDLLNGMVELAELCQAGVKLADTNGGMVDTNDPMQALMVAFKFANAQQERKNIGDRSRRGQRGAVSRGFNPGGRVYGFQTDLEVDDRGNRLGSRLVPHPETAEVVRRIFREYVGGASYGRIASALNEDRVSPPRAKAWSHTTIRSILNNPKYIGTARYGVTIRSGPSSGAKGKKRQMPANDKLEVNTEFCEPIVDEDTWGKAQARLKAVRADFHGKRDRGKPRGRGNRKHLLSGLVYCDHCGSSFEITKSRGIETYRCSGRKSKGKEYCSNRTTVRREDVEALVRRVLEGLHKDTDVLQKIVDEHNARVDVVNKQRSASLKKLDAKLKSNRKRQSNLAMKIADGLDVPAIEDLFQKLRDEEMEISAQREAVAEMVTPELRPSLDTARIQRGDEELFTGDVEEDRRKIEGAIARLFIHGDEELADPNGWPAGTPIASSGERVRDKLPVSLVTIAFLEDGLIQGAVEFLTRGPARGATAQPRLRFRNPGNDKDSLLEAPGMDLVRKALREQLGDDAKAATLFEGTGPIIYLDDEDEGPCSESGSVPKGI